MAGERKVSCTILLSRKGDGRKSDTIKLAPGSGIDVELNFEFFYDPPTGDGEIYFACDNRLEHVSLHVKFPEDK